MITRVKKKKLQMYLSDNTQAWLLHSDGSYQQLQHSTKHSASNAQALLLETLSMPLIEVT